MQHIKSLTDLRAAIVELENRQLTEGKLFKQQFHLAYESIKPVNLIKSTLKEVTNTTEIKNSILNTSVGMGAGYFSKLLFQAIAGSPLNKLMGTVLQFGITNAVAKNPDVIKSIGTRLINYFFNRKSKSSLKIAEPHSAAIINND